MGYALLSPLSRQVDSSLIYHWPYYNGQAEMGGWRDVVSGLVMGPTGTHSDNSYMTPHKGTGWGWSSRSNMDWLSPTSGSDIFQDWEAISITLWFKFFVTSGNNNRFLVNKFWDGSNRCFNLESSSSDKVSWNVSTNSINNNGGPVSNTGIAAGKWNFLTATWFAGTSNNARLLLNGRLDAQTTRSGTTLRNNTEEFRFASSYNGGFARVAMANIMIHRREITEAQHRNLFDYPGRGKKLIVPLGGVVVPTLAIDDMSAATTMNNVDLTTESTLVVDDMSATTTMDNVDLTTTEDLSINDMMSATTMDPLSLSTDSTLTVEDMSSSTTMDNLTLQTGATLSIDFMSSETFMDNVELTTINTLAVNDMSSVTTMDAISLTTDITLTVEDMSSVTTMDNVVLNTASTLVIDDMTSATLIDSLTLDQDSTLSIADMLVATTVEDVSLSTVVTLTIADMSVVTTMDQCNISAIAGAVLFTYVIKPEVEGTISIGQEVIIDATTILPE